MPKMCRCRTDQTKAGRFSGSVWIRGSASELLVPEAMARYSQPRVWWGTSTSWVTIMSGVHSNTLSQGVSASKIPCKYTHLPSKYPFPLPITHLIYIPYRYPIHDTQLTYLVLTAATGCGAGCFSVLKRINVGWFANGKYGTLYHVKANKHWWIRKP